MQKSTKLNTKWNLTELFKDINDKRIWENLDKTKSEVEKFCIKWKNKNDYLENKNALRESLDEYELLMRNYGISGKAGYYAHLVSSLDQNDPEVKALVSKVTNIADEINNSILFYSLNLSKISEEKQKEFLEAKELTKYKHFLELLFARSKYLLSENEERILNLMSKTSYVDWFRMTSGFIAKEEAKVLTEEGEKKLPFSSIIGLLEVQDKKVRDSAANAINNIFRKHLEVGENELNAILAFKKTIDDLKGYERPDKSRHISDDVTSEMVDSLIDVVTSKFEISKKYYELKAKLLGVKKLKYHERNIEYGKLENKYPYEKAFFLVKEVLGNLDPVFGEIIQKYNDEGRIDVYPSKGKSSGAFCTHDLITLPTYILLNQNDTLGNIMTLAHEVGHGINNELIKEKQHALYFKTPVSTAEVASTFMEDFVLQKLMEDADEEEKLALMMMKLNDDISTIFRQIACYKLEQDLHESYRKDGYLSKEKIGEIFQKNMKAYTGDFVSYDKGSENWWLYWSHIRYFFYVYSYASGLLISKSLQNMVKNNPKEIEKVKQFLATGTSKSPAQTFMDMGIDINDKSFWLKGIQEIEELLKETEELAIKLGKI